MNEQQAIHQHIDAILASIEQQRDEAEQAFPAMDEQQTHYQPHIIDVYIIDHADEEPPTVESTLDIPHPERQDDDEPEQPATPPLPSHRSRPRWRVVALVVLCLLLIGAGTYGYLLQRFTPSATITIVTQSQQLTTTTTLHLVTSGAADSTKNQLAGRVLPAITMSQQQTVPTTGTAHQDAKAGHGSITFYNGATYRQTIVAGTLLTGTDGIQLVTDADATIPAALFPTFGQVSVPAHAAITGPLGNVRAGDIYGARCRLNVSAVNGAFTGGQDARSYPSVTEADIKSVLITIKTSLDQSIQAALQTQVHASETLLTPLPCTVKTTPDHQVGEEAAQVQVLVNETCTGITYDTQEFTRLAIHSATQEAAHQLGTDYTTTDVQSHITKTTSKF